MTYEINITAENQVVGVEPLYVVSVIPPGELSAPTAKINEHDLQAILQEVLSPSSSTEVREHLNKAYSLDGDRIEIPNLSEAHIKMLRGSQQSAAGH
jgi:hypothetical protein